MSLLILPVIIVAAQEAIRAVPNDIREASYGMGATKWQTIIRVVLPSAIPGILTGSYFSSFSCSWRNSTISSNWYSSYYSVSYLRIYLVNLQHYQCKFMTGQNVHKQNSNLLLQQGFLY